MTPSKLPARPSLDSLRKQARKLARDVAARDAKAIARARTQLPQASLPLSQRDAQLVLAREYGFPSWKDLIKEVNQRLGKGLDWAVSEARRIIHDNDVDALRRLLAEYPALLSWRADDNDGGLLGMATWSYGDSGDAFREEHFTRLQCAEMLLDAGAVVAPSISDNVIQSRAKGLIDLFQRKGLFPQSLKFSAALGDVDDVRARLALKTDDLLAVNEALMHACHLNHPDAAALLLDRSIALDPEPGRKIDGGPGRAAFIEHFPVNPRGDTFRTPWRSWVKQQIVASLHEENLTAFVQALRSEPWLLSDEQVEFQVEMIEVALSRQEPFMTALFDLDPAVLHRRTPPPSQALDCAFTYAKTQWRPLLLRIWPLPDDLPHAAAVGDLARVRRWFDEEGKPALGNLANHFPLCDAHFCSDFVQWFGKPPGEQRVLDTALAWAVINNHFEVADFLLAHGADINTSWSSHEPASILHELVGRRNFEAIQFVIDRGIDMTIEDYRWHGTAEGWARVANKDEQLGQFLEDAQQRRERTQNQNP